MHGSHKTTADRESAFCRFQPLIQKIFRSVQNTEVLTPEAGLSHLYFYKKRVRTGSVSASDFDTFMSKLELEVWKENIGEGQYFFYLKRINSPTLVSTTQTIQMADKYVFPIPDSETTLK